MMGIVDSLVYSMGKKVQSKSKSTETELTQKINEKADQMECVFH